MAGPCGGEGMDKQRISGNGRKLVEYERIPFMRGEEYCRDWAEHDWGSARLGRKETRNVSKMDEAKAGI